MMRKKTRYLGLKSIRKLGTIYIIKKMTLHYVQPKYHFSILSIGYEC